MAEKDIFSLMSELNIDSTQQEGAHIRSLDEDETHRNAHRRRCRRRSGPKKVYDDYTSPQEHRPPTNSTGHDRHAPSSAKSQEPPSPTNANFDSTPKVGAQSASSEAIAANDDLSSKVQPARIYIVQIMWPSEEIEGVYYSSKSANNRAIIYLKTKHGINENEISEKRGRFGQAITATKAVKRMWTHTDRSGGLFVIGAYQSHDEAWEGCKKYWTDLSIRTREAERKQRFQEESITGS
ncbi:hypothetical protein N7524_011812 [Penicillium chrysogenum]|nr:hypothetical protein N7524_011812 [Penicillium chrysogenum]